MFELKRNIHSSLHRPSHFYFFAACAWVGVLLLSITALPAQTPSARQATKDSEEVRKLREAVRELQAEVAKLKNEIRNFQPSAAAANATAHAIPPSSLETAVGVSITDLSAPTPSPTQQTGDRTATMCLVWVAGQQGTDMVNSVV